MPRLEPGDVAPPFSLTTDEGTVSLSNYQGRDVVVYFYPADDTPGCTKEACQFSELHGDFSRLGVDVIGISPDDTASHGKFRQKHGLSVVLASDPSHEVMQAYGAYGEKTLYGRKSVGVIRSTFIIGGDGRIKKAWYSVRADGHAAKVLASLGS